MSIQTPTPEISAPEILTGLQASAAALLGTAAVILRPDGQPRGPLSAQGAFYRALAAYPAGRDWLLQRAASMARTAQESHLTVTGHEQGLGISAFPLPGEQGTSLTLVVFTTPGIRPDLRPALAADLGVPAGALPSNGEPFDSARVTATLSTLEAALSVSTAHRAPRPAGEPEIRRDRVAYEAATALSRPLSEAKILATAAQFLTGILHMDQGIPYRFTGGEWVPSEGCTYLGEPVSEADPLVLTAEQEITLTEGGIVEMGDMGLPHGRRVIVPLLAVTQDQRWLEGVVLLQTAHVVRKLLSGEEQLALLVGRQAAMALSNAHTAEMEKTLARKLQDTLQSHVDSGAIPSLHVEKFYRPAARDANVGGDFFDVFPLPDGRAAVLVGDVAGKGVDAAVHTNVARYTLRSYALLNADPAEVLRLTNEALARFPEFRDFLTAVLIIVDPAAEQLTYASAGHPAAILYRQQADAFGMLESTGTLLGMMPGLTWRSATHKWSHGDCLLLYTDGISEAHAPGSEELFETTRIRDVFAANRHAPAHEVVSAIFHAAKDFAGGIMHDDCAMLLVTQA